MTQNRVNLIVPFCLHLRTIVVYLGEFSETAVNIDFQFAMIRTKDMVFSAGLRVRNASSNTTQARMYFQSGFSVANESRSTMQLSTDVFPVRSDCRWSESLPAATFLRMYSWSGLIAKASPRGDQQ